MKGYWYEKKYMNFNFKTLNPFLLQIHEVGLLKNI